MYPDLFTQAFELCRDRDRLPVYGLLRYHGLQHNDALRLAANGPSSNAEATLFNLAQLLLKRGSDPSMDALRHVAGCPENQLQALRSHSYPQPVTNSLETAFSRLATRLLNEHMPFTIESTQGGAE